MLLLFSKKSAVDSNTELIQQQECREMLVIRSLDDKPIRLYKFRNGVCIDIGGCFCKCYIQLLVILL